VDSWTGTDGDASGATTNTLTMPAIDSGATVHYLELPGPALSFFTLLPCRILDTRDPPGAYGGPVLSSSVARVVDLRGRCGVPATAQAVSVNITVVAPSAAGFLTLYPGDRSVPLASTINFSARQIRSNNAIFRLSTGSPGLLGIWPSLGDAGTVHLVIDVNGFFE
jgi:hypothetical protein